MTMKTTCWLILTLLATAVPSTAPAAIYNWTTGFDNSGTVPDGNASGWSDSRSVSDLGGPIIGINVLLNLSGGFNGDLYGYLAHNNQLVVLLNRVGVSSGNFFGYGDTGFNVVLSDGAAGEIHFYGGNGGAVVNGTFQPDGRNINPLSAPALFDTAVRQNNGSPLGLFNGMDGNGIWTLYLADLSNGEVTKVQSWGLELVAVPEPNSFTLLLTATAWMLRALRAGKIRNRPVP